MSIRAIVWAFDQKIGNASAKLVLLKLADNANDEGKCWPSLFYLAKHCELNREQVSKYCKMLADRGFINITHRIKDGVSLPNIYNLNMDAGIVSQTTGGPGIDNTVLSDRQPEPSYEPSYESKNPDPPKRGAPSAGLSKQLKEAGDRIYKTDPQKFKRLVVWIKQAQKEHFPENEIIYALERFLPYAGAIDLWYPYLDKLIYKARSELSKNAHNEEHRRRNNEDRDLARSFDFGALLGDA